MYIHNLSVRAPRVIEQHLQDEGFLHVSRILGGTKLDPTLINALVEGWRPETHAFHLLWGECTITLEDITLRLDLLVDGAVVMRVLGVGDWSAICKQLLDKVSDKFRGSRIEMKLLKDNFNYIDNLASDVERQQYLRAFIMRLIRGFLMLDKS
ncbi:hypothetical protein PVK06_020048 [Gossypium arboreum]|uniref:Aminotransferase-like plant mobile domain-containing protein n=1 Tax=Gossypium arboreum TaxID=29729 RepID=A0ABR0PLF5_GOSAR|nr:hypothetical protein PVK06_020048 [Gossypium arboreum]